ncbi:hypothetical protein GJ496_007372 [Pomphorhynchus laevis]|nr:hypothetical protein GJ496_007372 [Pomphorhynchus laevis]
MPTISVARSDFTRYYGRTLSVEDLEKLCFEFGIELDEICGSSDADPVYRLEVAANRYDLLSPIGICNALRLFTRRGSILPKFAPIKSKYKLEVDSRSLQHIRPVIASCIVQNVDLNQQNNMQNLINLQEKIHQNLGRNRTLVSIGLHDLDKVSSSDPPTIRYSAICPEQLAFSPLGLKSILRGRDQLEKYYTESSHLKSYYQTMLEKHLKWPVVTNSQGEVLSQPPVINSNQTIVTSSTKNLLIEVTGTDLQRCKLALIALIYQLPWSLDGGILYYHQLTDFDLSARNFMFSIRELCAALPEQQVPDAYQIKDMLTRMGYENCQILLNNNEQNVVFDAPVYRADILHLCDIQEDICIAFGYQNISNRLDGIRFTEGKQLAIERLCTDCRDELARCGYYEALTFVLCPKEEVDLSGSNGSLVLVANACSSQCTSVRQVLWCGLVKTLAGNQHIPMPIRLFEIGDVIQSAITLNQRRHATWLFAGKRSGFEDVVGTLDRIFSMLSIDVKLQPIINDSLKWIPGRAANIVDKDAGEQILYGYIGILNPDLMDKLFKIQIPCTVCEIDLDAVLSHVKIKSLK